MRDTEREAKTQAEGKTGSSQEPDAGLDPQTLGSQPETKADAQPLSHPGAPSDWLSTKGPGLSGCLTNTLTTTCGFLTEDPAKLSPESRPTETLM